MPFWAKIYFQNSNSPLMEHLIFFHDHAMVIIFLIVIWVFQVMYSSLSNTFFNRFFSESQEIEYFWTILPSFILIFLAFPSMKILYMTEEFILEKIMSVKVEGHQWYWTYEYSDLTDWEFDSFEEYNNLMRLMDTSFNVILFKNAGTQFLISSDDVIHSWTVPSLGVKADAIPGRINQVMVRPNRIGIFVGQCSEICGANHSFMPITIFVTKLNSIL